MDQPLLVGILEGFGHLLDVGQKRGQGKARPSGIASAQGAVGGVLHDQIGQAVLHAKVQHAHDMRMFESGDGARLGEKVGQIIFPQAGMQDFDGGLALEMEMLGEVDLCEAAFAEQAH